MMNNRVLQVRNFSVRIYRFAYKYLHSAKSSLDYYKNRILNFMQLRSGFFDPSLGMNVVQVVYINLDRRSDRRKGIEKEFSRMKLENVQRIPAHEADPPGKGCTLSHKTAASSTINGVDTLLMICEDDARFMRSSKKLIEILDAFSSDKNADVLCLGYFIQEFQTPYSQTFQRLRNSQSAVCYVLKQHMVSSFLSVCEISINRFAMNPNDPNAAIDQVWKELQKKYVFVAPYAPYVTQKPSYSDIAKGYARYPSSFRLRDK